MAKIDCRRRHSVAATSARPLTDADPHPCCVICGATDDLELLELPRCPFGPPSDWYCGPHAMAAIGFLIHRRAMAQLTRAGSTPPLVARSWKSFAAARSEGGAQALNYSLTLERAVRNLLAVIARDR